MFGYLVGHVPRDTSDALAEQIDFRIRADGAHKQLVVVERLRLNDKRHFRVLGVEAFGVAFERLLVVEEHVRRFRANVGRELFAQRRKIDANHDVVHVDEFAFSVALR